MKKIALTVFAFTLLSTAMVSCRENKSAADEVEDVVDDVEDAVD